MLRALRDALPEAIGRNLPISVNGANLAILFGLEFPLPALKGIAILCRTAGLIGQAERPIGFIL